MFTQIRVILLDRPYPPLIELQLPSDVKSNWSLCQRQARITAREYEHDTEAAAELRYSKKHLPRALSIMGIELEMA